MTFVSELEPREVWIHFDRILEMPRGSKNERAAADYVRSVARGKGLLSRQDEVGNVVVQKPGTPGNESAPITILQCHLDMVNEKNSGVEHDFSRDPIQPVLEHGYLKANGTTLGSDNGIGIAAALAVADSTTTAHGPLEFLFTVDEETGLTGASNLSNELLSGRTLINLDTEEEGSLYVGCAGGAGANLSLPLPRVPSPPGLQFWELRLFGLRGGHSGVDIHLQRGNAIKLLARVLRETGETFETYLVDIAGGNMHNAIPREARAGIAVPAAAASEFPQLLNTSLEGVRAEFRPVEPDFRWKLSKAAPAEEVADEQTTRTILAFLDALPHGVMSMSYDIPDLVETSANVATVGTQGQRIQTHVSNRSSVPTALQALQQRVASIGLLAGAQIEIDEGYPGWKPNLNSRVLRIAQATYRNTFGHEPRVKAVHAGLECGIIGVKYPGMDMVSFGPQIEFPHSPDERVRIDSVSGFYRLLTAVLEALAQDTEVA